MKKRIAIFSLLLCTLFVFSTMTASADISPTSIEATLNPGESVSEEKTVTIPEGPATQGDVVFALDLTGSMDPEIAAAKAQASGIMTALTAVITDVQFGVVSFMDYPARYTSCGYTATYGYAPQDYAYQMDQAVTADTGAVQTALNGLTAASGGDGPQDYTRIIYEMYTDATIGWRTGSIKFLIMFGDAPTHDCDLFTESYGADPGPDAVIGNGDDLDFETTVAAANAFGLKIIAMDSSDRFASLHPYSDDAQASFEYMAFNTGGMYVNSYGLTAPYTAIIEMITGAIAEVVSVIDLLRLSVDPIDFSSWVSTNPTSYTDVIRPDSRTFTVTITVPEDTECGTYEFEIWADGDGADYGRQSVTITVPCISTGTPIPVLSNALTLLPIALVATVLIIRRKR